MKTLLLCFALTLAARAESCTLQTWLDSRMPSGYPFTVTCPSGNYNGVTVTVPAKRFFRRGSIMLKFNQPVTTVTKDSEGVIKPSRKKQIGLMILSGGAGIGAKDLLDGLSGAVFKSYYMIPVTFVAAAAFQTGGDLILRPGYQITLEPAR